MFACLSTRGANYSTVYKHKSSYTVVLVLWASGEPCGASGRPCGAVVCLCYGKLNKKAAVLDTLLGQVLAVSLVA